MVRPSLGGSPGCPWQLWAIPAFQFTVIKGRDLKPEDIWSFRIRHNLTGSQLAERLGVHKSQISRWETMQRPIPLWMEKFLACLDSAVSGKEHVSAAAQQQHAGGFKEKGR
jgi:hypothetical protein